MKSLLLLVDSRKYIRTNCYQHQLARTLAKNFDVRMMSMREVRWLPLARPPRYDYILSVLRLRTLVESLDPISRLLGDAPLHIYDQDPWQGFMDDSPYRGAYSKIVSRLNVSGFLLTSMWWRDLVASRGLPAKFVRMGVIPEYCDAGPDWEARPIRVGFQGTLHSHRRVFYDRLNELGLKVDVLRSTPYEGYLSNLHRMRVYVHTEDAPWTVDGKLMPRNALWIKETEVAARGTFAIRDYEEEAEAYGISELPTVMPYRRVEDVPEIVAQIEAMRPSERRDRMVASAEAMRRRDDWTTVVRAIQA
jgi:hypothetical protein